jgi:CRP-like cAMP-binding protein
MHEVNDRFREVGFAPGQWIYQAGQPAPALFVVAEGMVRILRHTPRGRAVRAKAERAYEFLWQHLIPHAKAEDAALYPVVQKVMGAPRATATMSRDRVEVGTLTGELAEAIAMVKPGEFPADVGRDLRRTLYALYALVHMHFAKEGEIYLPMLEASLSSD